MTATFRPNAVPQPWPVPPLLQATAAVHMGAAAALVAAPSLWAWPVGALVLNHALLTFTGLWPRSTALGRNLLRLPQDAAARGEVALTIDDGPDPEVTPQVLDLLDAAGARATFFCIAERARRHPQLVREIVRRGHSVQNHSNVHRHNFSLLGPRGFRREIEAAQHALTEACGHAPTLFRAPAGLRNPFLAPVLHRMGLTLASWTRRGFDTRVADPLRVLARLTRGLAAGDILLLHDGNSARTAQGRPVVLEVLPTLLAAFQREGLKPVTLPEALRHAPMTAETLIPSVLIRPDAAEWRRLLDLACAPYQQAGRFAWHFARGKLGMDPVFRHLVGGGLVPPRARVLDIGCGQGLLASLLRACAEMGAAGEWPRHWPAAPAHARITGVELMSRDVERARTALGPAPDCNFVCGDMRTEPFPESDVVVILDVLHYVTHAEQDEVLRRVRDALVPGGRLLLRVGDAASRKRFAISQWVDRVVTRIRGHSVPPTYGRPLALWMDSLKSLGMRVQARPMSQGTPFANVLVVAQKP